MSEVEKLKRYNIPDLFNLVMLAHEQTPVYKQSSDVGLIVYTEDETGEPKLDKETENAIFNYLNTLKKYCILKRSSTSDDCITVEVFCPQSKYKTKQGEVYYSGVRIRVHRVEHDRFRYYNIEYTEIQVSANEPVWTNEKYDDELMVVE